MIDTQKIKNGFRSNLNGWTYISIKGSPKERGYAYGKLISNLITCRNLFLDINNLNPINDTFFTEFSVNCVGETDSIFRESMLRTVENITKGRRKISYFPSKYLENSTEETPQFDVKRATFPNTSGNIIQKEKQCIFIIQDGKLLENNVSLIEENTIEASE